MKVESKRANIWRWRKLVSEQHGIVTVQNLSDHGIGRGVYLRRIRMGEWQQLHRGLFKVGSQPMTRTAFDVAALLAAGPRSALSHQSAARHLGLDIPAIQHLHVSIPESTRASVPAFVRVKRARDLAGEDLTQRGALRYTRLGRTLVDLASVLDERWLAAALDSALRQYNSNFRWVKYALERHGNGRAGVQRLASLVAQREKDGEVPDSVLESFALELGLFSGRRPLIHYPVTDGNFFVGELDLAWPHLRLAIEFDGWRTHSSRRAFEEDRARDRQLSNIGWAIQRFTWNSVNGYHARYVHDILEAHRRRSEQLVALSPPNEAPHVP